MEVVWAKTAPGVWGLGHVFDGKLCFTRDICEEKWIPKDLASPKKPLPTPKARAKPTHKARAKPQNSPPPPSLPLDIQLRGCLPRPPPCASTGRCFQDFLGPLLFVVLNAGLGICDALVEGKKGSFMSVIVLSVHNNIVPHVANPCGWFGCGCRPRLTSRFSARPSRAVLCWRACRAHTRACLRGSLKCSARTVQLFGCLAVLETHTLRY